MESNRFVPAFRAKICIWIKLAIKYTPELNETSPQCYQSNRACTRTCIKLGLTVQVWSSVWHFRCADHIWITKAWKPTSNRFKSVAILWQFCHSLLYLWSDLDFQSGLKSQFRPLPRLQLLYALDIRALHHCIHLLMTIYLTGWFMVQANCDPIPLEYLRCFPADGCQVRCWHTV